MSKSGKPTCPECGKAATGNFCQHCGATLGGRFCNKCGAKLQAGAQFCNQCGQKSAGGGGGGGGAHKEAAAAAVGGQNLPWWIAGFAMFGLITVIGLQMVRPDPEGQSAPTTSPAAGPAAGMSAVDLNSMTPLQAADRLFNRVMTSISQGDSTDAQAFLPMAIDAYTLVEAPSDDALFHLALLQRTALRLDAALATAQQILERSPNHLLGLSAAAEAAAEMGSADQANAFYQQIVEVYDAEMASAKQEYLDHSGITNGLKTVAEDFLAGR